MMPVKKRVKYFIIGDMAKFRQLILLLWKNFLLQFRHPWVTLFEIGVPTVFVVILIFIRLKVDVKDVDTDTIYNPFSINHLPLNFTIPKFYIDKWNLSDMEKISVMYAPQKYATDKVMSKVEKQFSINAIGFPSESDMIDYYLDPTPLNSTSSPLGGIVFEDLEGEQFGSKVNIKIRLHGVPRHIVSNPAYAPSWLTHRTFPLFQQPGPREPSKAYGGIPGYYVEGFLQLQHVVATSVAEVISENNTASPFSHKVQMQRYPYPPYINDKFLLALQFFFPITLFFSFIYPTLNIIKNLVVEKEKHIKESMKMMGLNNWLHWLAWFIKYFVFLMVSITIMTILMTVKVQGNLESKVSVYNNTNPFVLFLFFTCYLVSMISFSFLTSVFFSKANSATAGGGIIFFLSFIPYFAIFPRYEDLSLVEKLLSCLVSNTALSLGAIIICMWEGTGSGVQWGNISLPATPDDQLTLSMVMGMFILDSVIYLILALYIEAVFPGENGIPQPWYFPFTKQFWFGTSPLDYADLTPLNPEGNNEFLEKEPSNMVIGVQMMGLTKVFQKGKMAVNNLDLNMYEGHITALLGHNGAGKTTTISMLTGLFPPTSGRANVNGYDIRENIQGVQESLGICPQHDVLFDEMTVEEHLRFFCRLKNYLPDCIEDEVNRMIEALGLQSKRKAKSKTLSGGMKRKLSVGIALVGGSKVVMLDEPTSGMDPSARRYIWDLLQSEKLDRTILLTTHFMEEADVLGDRIAIMADGKIQCCGSPHFLKRKYGAGYHMKIVKSENCNVNAVIDLVRRYVPHAELESSLERELSFCLPNDSSPSFQNMFTEMTENQEALGISSYGVSLTTMEEVFLKVGEYSQQGMQMLDKSRMRKADSMKNMSAISNSESAGDSCSTIVSCASNPDIQNRGCPLFMQQLYALLAKRALYTRRNILLTLSQLALPVLFVAISLIILKTMPKPITGKPLVLNLDPFQGTTVPYSVSENPLEIEDHLAEAYKSQFNPAQDVPVQVSSNDSMIQYLLDGAQQNIGKWNLHNIIACSFKHDNATKAVSIKALFNNQAYHSPAISLAAVDNALLKTITNNSNIQLKVTNHPLPLTFKEKEGQVRYQTTDGFQIAQNIVFSMSFLAASFAVFLVKESSCKAKHLQRVSGVNLSTFWLANFLWDFVNYIFPCFLVMIVFVAFQQKGMSSAEEQGRILLVFILYGAATLPAVYCASFLFYSPSTAYVRLCLFGIVSGIGSFIAVTITEIPELNILSLSKALDWLFSILLPAYSLGRSFYNLFQNRQNSELCSPVTEICAICQHSKFKPECNSLIACCRDICTDNCVPWNPDFLGWESPGIGRLLLFLSLQCLAFTAILVILETKMVRSLKYFFQSKIHPADTEPRPFPSDNLPETADVATDNDVLAERQRILNTPEQNLFATDVLVMRNLTKVYDKCFVAVNQLCVGIRHGECFGLLGVNGAGKTTTFKMISGDEVITSGDLFVEGFNIKTKLKRVQQFLGYCPQFDGLIDQLTGKETLELFARLRGVPECMISSQIEELSRMLYLDAHIKKVVKTYSGGNKRKLSTAVALIGNPPIVLLDEPTTGMDPVARRCLWDALTRVLEHGQSIILTSHSMEECDALCSKLAIMVNGKFCCLGSPQHLKSKFGEGYMLLIKVGTRAAPTEETHATTSRHHFITSRSLENQFQSDVEKLKQFVEEKFPGCVLKGAHHSFLHYHIPWTTLSWAQIFGIMEQAKGELNIEDYSVSQTTLEQVFLNFARAQRSSSE